MLTRVFGKYKTLKLITVGAVLIAIPVFSISGNANITLLTANALDGDTFNITSATSGGAIMGATRTLAITGNGFVTELASMNFDGNSWIDTGIKPTDDMVAETTFLPSTVPMTGFQYLFGAAPAISKGSAGNSYPFAYEFEVTATSISARYCMMLGATTCSISTTGTTGSYTTLAPFGAQLGHRAINLGTGDYSLQMNWIDETTSTVHHDITGQSYTGSLVPSPTTIYLGATNDNGTAYGGGTNYVGNIYGHFTLSANDPADLGTAYSATASIVTGSTIADFIPGAWTIDDQVVYGYYERVDGALVVNLASAAANPSPMFTNTGSGTMTPSATASALVITVGGQACTHVTVLSNTLLTCDITTPPASGSYDVTIDNGGQTFTLSNGYTYTDPVELVPIVPNAGYRNY